MNEILILFSLLFTKHFIVDFPLQTKFQWSNKGTYGHLGGILHSAIHAAGTCIVMIFFVPIHTALFLALLDCIVHYHIDYAKTNLNAKLGLGPTTHEQFWWLLGLDQFLHYMTYVGLIFIATK